MNILGFITPSDGPQDWFSGGGTTDYYQSCIPGPGGASVPQGAFAYQFPQDGEYFIGLGTYEVNLGGQREYAMVQLETPLAQGQSYYVSFYANAAWNGSLQNPQNYTASSHIGALFTMQPRPWTVGDPWSLATGILPQVYHPWIISDTVAWTLVSGSFVADSAYQYLMLGNHFDNSNTDTLNFTPPQIWLPIAYTLIDNVCVSIDPDGCPLALGVAAPTGSDVLLFPNPAVNELQVQGLATDASATVYDVLGQVLWSGRITAGTWRLHVSAWARGSYVLRLAERDNYRSYKFVLIE